MDAPEHAAVVELRAAKALAPYARNARTHTKEQVAQVAESIRRFRWTNPILIDEADGIVAGHARVLAAHEIFRKGEAIQTVGGTTLPMGQVPVIVARGWSDAERRAYILADNKLALNAGWDNELLKIELGALGDMGFDIGLIGFGADELGLIFDSDGAGAGGQLRLGSLTERFLIAPFTVLNARDGWWQDRKRGWIALGIQSELGRGENALGFSETVLEPDPEKRAKRFNASPGRNGRNTDGACADGTPGAAAGSMRKAASAKPGGNALRTRESMADASAANTLGPMRAQYSGKGGNLPRPPESRNHIGGEI